MTSTTVMRGMGCAVAMMLLVGQAAYAQDQAREELCRTALITRVSGNALADAKSTTAPCQQLATLVFVPLSAAFADVILRPDAVNVARVFSQRDLQPRHPQEAALGGTAAQGQAVPGVQPAGVAAGTIAAIGTEAGNDAIAALSINPAMLFLTDLATETTAQYSRFLDLTMFVPVSGVEPADGGSRGLKYFGVRLRANVQGVRAGSEVWRESEQLFIAEARRSARTVTDIRDLLRQAPDVEGCVAALMATAPVDNTVVTACGQPLVADFDLATAERMRRSLAAVRRAADSRYFGADVRVDIGDPTLGAVENARGTFLFLGLAYGQRLLGAAETGGGGFRARLGARHAKLETVDKAEFAVEGGLGFDIARAINDTQEINASAAVEFRHGSTAESLIDQFETNFGMLRGSVMVPMTAANNLSLNFGVPLWGEVSPILSVNFNWGLLLSQALSGGAR